MAKRVRSFFEPWATQPTRDWHKGFGDEPPPVDDPEITAKWWAARDRAERNAEWVVWGSGMFAPSVAYGFPDGEPHVMDGAHVITRVRPVHTDAEKPPPHGEIARRIVLCVNACAGLANPVALIDATRALLSDLAWGVSDASDPRVVSLLARWAVDPGNTVAREQENSDNETRSTDEAGLLPGPPGRGGSHL